MGFGWWQKSDFFFFLWVRLRGMENRPLESDELCLLNQFWAGCRAFWAWIRRECTSPSMTEWKTACVWPKFSNFCKKKMIPLAIWCYISQAVPLLWVVFLLPEKDKIKLISPNEPAINWRRPQKFPKQSHILIKDRSKCSFSYSL